MTAPDTSSSRRALAGVARRRGLLRRFLAFAAAGLAASVAITVVSGWAPDSALRRLDATPVAGTPYYDPSLHLLFLIESPGQRIYTSRHSTAGASSLSDPAANPAQARARFRAHRPNDIWAHITWDPAARVYHHSIRTNGWPWPAFWCEYDQDWQADTITARGGIAFDHHWVLPLRPMPLGLAADTLVFGAAAWGLASGVGLVRARRRARRGGCPACGYDLRGEFAGGCPECGWGREERGRR